jgi:hypothetical protein
VGTDQARGAIVASPGEIMSRRIAALVMLGIALAASGADAQELRPAPAAVEVTIMPAAAVYFTDHGDSPGFGSYVVATAVTFNVNEFAAIEGEVGGMIATTSDLQLGDPSRDTGAPHMLNYTANLVVSPWRTRAIAPYASMGLGGLTMFERRRLGMASDESFLTTTFGGGVKWYARNPRWGLRADYRFAATKAKDDVPEFFGREHRYSHRISAGVIITAGR